MTLSKLPVDILKVIKTYLDTTRLDWRTCKHREASLIRQIEFANVLEIYSGELYDVEPEMLDWTMFGRLFISKGFRISPGWHARDFPPTIPPCMEDIEDEEYCRWYCLDYRWVNYGVSE
jgi:hypothetical protein